jgi:hypothetical protein
MKRKRFSVEQIVAAVKCHCPRVERFRFQLTAVVVADPFTTWLSLGEMLPR